MLEKSMAPTNKKVSNHIPDDIAFSILSKLPLKSIKRFSCIRKSWAFLFENPYFLSMYLNNFISKSNSCYDDTNLLLKQSVSGPEHHCQIYLLSGERFENKVKLELPPPFQEDDTDIHVLGSGFNGTLCLYRDFTTIVLWNPATKEFKVTPPSPIESLPRMITLTIPHGFGYDHVKDDYKVIRRAYFISYHYDSEGDWGNVPIRIIPSWELYSLRSNSWRKLDVDMPIRDMNCVGANVYMDGVCHWWGEESNEAYLVSFNLSNEVSITTPLPFDLHHHLDSEWVERHLMVLNGSIALILNNEETTFHISILGELGIKESWTKLFIIGPLSCVQHPIGVGKNGDIFFRKKDDELVWFDLNTQMIMEIGVKGELFNCQIVIYKESLLPIGGINN